MPLLEKWTPLRELDLIDRRMRRLFGDLSVVPPLAPAADVYDAGGEFVVELEVPGFDEKELEIELTDHTLRIAGERHDETERKEKELRLHERLEATFERHFALPAEVDKDHIRADYAKGVLTVHVPKADEAKPRKVEITKT
jgi:HSP20 family protein